MNYTQLTREQRYQIYALMKAGHNQTQIAVVVGCHKSTISRELRRNRGQKGYRPYQADELAFDRQCNAYRARIAGQTWQQVELLLRQEWSPEQIAGRLKLERQPTVSHECIYTSMLTNGAAARCIAIYAVRRSSASVIADTTVAARSPTAPASISVPRSWLAKVGLATGKLTLSWAPAIKAAFSASSSVNRS